MSEDKTGKFEQIVTRGVTWITAASVFIAAGVHIATFLPETYSNFFPEQDIELLEFYSQSDLTIANRGDFDYFMSGISHSVDNSVVNAALQDMAPLITSVFPTYCKKRFESGRQSVENDCDTRLASAEKQYIQLAETASNPDAWVPSSKKRGIDMELPKETVIRSQLSNSGWGQCPFLLKVDEAQKQKAIALWASSHRIMPWKCLYAYYYSDGDDRYTSQVQKDQDFASASFPAEGALHFYKTNGSHTHTSTNDDPDLVQSATFESAKIQGLVMVLKYDNSPFCRDLIEEVLDYDEFILSQNGSCRKPR
jgi:hypothetical protein